VRGGPATAVWQPSRYDRAVIAGGTAVVDATGQHAGALQVAPSAGAAGRAAPVLAVNAGWLEVEDALTIGGRGRAGGRAGVAVTGGVLDVGLLEKANADARFALAGGTLRADRVAFDLVADGGMIAPRLRGGAGRLRIAANLTINRGGLTIGVTGRGSDSVEVDGAARVGGTLQVTARDGFSPRPGDAWTIVRARRGVTGRFTSVTPGYRVAVVGDRVVLTYGVQRRS